MRALRQRRGLARRRSRGLVGVLRSLGGSAAAARRTSRVVPRDRLDQRWAAPPSLPRRRATASPSTSSAASLARLSTTTSVKAVVLRIDSPGGSRARVGSALEAADEAPRRRSRSSSPSATWPRAAATTSRRRRRRSSPSRRASSARSASSAASSPSARRSKSSASTPRRSPAAPDPQQGARSSYLSPFTPWDDPTREKVLASMTAVYDLFLRRVAEGRGTTVETIAPSCRGPRLRRRRGQGARLMIELGGLSGGPRRSPRSSPACPRTRPRGGRRRSRGFSSLLDEKDAAAAARRWVRRRGRRCSRRGCSRRCRGPRRSWGRSRRCSREAARSRRCRSRSP